MESQELVDARRDEIANMPKRGQPFLFAAFHAAGIGEAPMDLVAGVGKVGTGFCRLITDGDDQIHGWLRAKFLQVLSAMVAEINPNFLHGFDRQRMDDARLSASAEDLVGASASSAQQTLCHLRPG